MLPREYAAEIIFSSVVLKKYRTIFLFPKVCTVNKNTGLIVLRTEINGSDPHWSQYESSQDLDPGSGCRKPTECGSMRIRVLIIFADTKS
jgi:hypothetical protein